MKNSRSYISPPPLNRERDVKADAGYLWFMIGKCYVYVREEKVQYTLIKAVPAPKHSNSVGGQNLLEYRA